MAALEAPAVEMSGPLDPESSPPLVLMVAGVL